jgi:sec-independent protein translocase protein TatA
LFRNIGWPELLLIALVILLLFGGRRIPELMRSLGSGIRQFKTGMREGEDAKPTPDAKPGGDKPSEKQE